MERQQDLFKILLGCGIIAHVNLIREALSTECVSLETITLNPCKLWYVYLYADLLIS